MRKKQHIFMLIISLSLFSSGCATPNSGSHTSSGSQNSSNDGQDLTISLVRRSLSQYIGPDDDSHEKFTWNYGSNNALEEYSVHTYSDDGLTHIITSYSSETVLNNTTLLGTYKYYYDSNSNVIRGEMFDASGKLLSQFSAKYHDTHKNNYTIYTEEDGNGNVLEHRRATYNSKGFYTSETYYSDVSSPNSDTTPDSSLIILQYTCEYDPPTRPIKETKWEKMTGGESAILPGDGETGSSGTDTQGHSVTTIYTFDYNSNGQRYLMKSFQDGKNDNNPLDVIQYQFDDHNRKIVRSYYSYGSLQSSRNYSYDDGTDSEDDLGLEIHYDKNDKIINTFTYNSYPGGSNIKYYEEIVNSYTYGTSETSRSIAPSHKAVNGKWKKPRLQHHFSY